MTKIINFSNAQMPIITATAPRQEVKTGYVQEFDGWKVGQECQVKEWNGTYRIDHIYCYSTFTQVRVLKIARNGSTKGSNTTDINNLLPIGAAQPTTDKDGKTALQKAQEILKINGFAVKDWYYTTQESLVVVISHTKTGRVKIQRARIIQGEKMQKDMETFSLDMDNLRYTLDKEQQIFIPKLFGGEWHWWNDSETLKPFKGNKLTRLLD